MSLTVPLTLSIVLLLGDPTLAADPSPPRTIQLSDQAKPLAPSQGADLVAPTRSPQRTMARWGDTRRRQLGDSARSTRRIVEPVAGDSAESDRLNLSNYVRPTSHTAPVDPFDDPFGDRATTESRRVPARTIQAAAPIQMDEPPLTSPPPAAKRTEAPLQVRQMPQTPVLSQRRAERGPPEYNRRDCDDEMQRCRDARTLLRQRPITNISVDITPPFTMARLGDHKDQDYQRELEMTLAQAKPRPFRNRSGEVIAEGSLKDYRHGRVYIADRQGDVTEVPFAELSDDDMCFVTAWWSIPSECALDSEPYQERQWLASTMTWKASSLGHKPLYFEQPQLERYGHTPGPIVEPFMSTGHFFLSLVSLPYQMGMHPPNECQYDLGHYRPGNCAPWLMPPLPLSLRGALLTAGVYTGGVFIIP